MVTEKEKKNHQMIVHPSLTLLITLLSIYIFSQFSFSPAVMHNYMHTKIENKCYTHTLFSVPY
jgi:hypothetical protein